MIPRYPIYIPSKGRALFCKTADLLHDDGIPFYIVIQPQDFDAYSAVYGDECLLVLPAEEIANVTWPLPFTRSWIKDHATALGYKRHWQIDDDIRQVSQVNRGKATKCSPCEALATLEGFIDRYTNVAIAGLRHQTFAYAQSRPFDLNHQVATCVLVLNELPHRWRPETVEDTDFCLQVLASGWCTIQFNIFAIAPSARMALKGGNTDTLCQTDGEVNVARTLQRQWPGVVRSVTRKYGRPRVVLNRVWSKCDNRLIRVVEND